MPGLGRARQAERVPAIVGTQRRTGAAPDGGQATIRFLAVLPFLGILVGPWFLNRVTPFVFGLPLLLAWILLWIVLTSVILGAIYLSDPANRGSEAGE